MINKNAKGRRNENKTKELFEANGFVVHSTTRSSYKGTNDIFGLFDHALISRYPMRIIFEETFMDLAGTELPWTIYIQTKSNTFRLNGDELRQFFMQFQVRITVYELIWKDRENKPYMRAYTWDPIDRTIATRNVMQIFSPYDEAKSIVGFNIQRINNATNYQLIEEVQYVRKE